MRSAAASWPARAAVKNDEPAADVPFDPSMPDFLVELLPFGRHAGFQSAPEDARRLALSCGWIAYNEKTVAIESTIVGPLCARILAGAFDGVNSESCKQAVAQAMVDEAYHVLLVLDANRVTREHRGLLDLRLPEFELITRLRGAQERQADAWRRDAVLLMCGTAIETTISDYLKLMSSAPGVQPLNVLTTDIHRRDESAHAGIFKSITRMIYAASDRSQREFLVDVMSQPIRWLASRELGVWRAMLRQIGFPSADELIDDCAEREDGELSAAVDAGVRQLAAKLGIDDEPGTAS